MSVTVFNRGPLVLAATDFTISVIFTGNAAASAFNCSIATRNCKYC
jgi:hypothetical protein